MGEESGVPKQIDMGNESNRSVLSPLELIVAKHLTIDPDEPKTVSIGSKALAQALRNDPAVLELGIDPDKISRKSVDRIRAQINEKLGLKAGTSYL